MVGKLCRHIVYFLSRGVIWERSKAIRASSSTTASRRRPRAPGPKNGAAGEIIGAAA